MPKPITTAVAKHIVGDVITDLAKQFAEVDAEFLASTKDYFAKSDARHHMHCVYLQIALRSVIGAVGGDEAEQALVKALGREPDDHHFGRHTINAAESDVRRAREQRLTTSRTRRQAGAAA